MKIIGITGKSGSGKSTLANLLAKELNCAGIDVDKIGHKATNDENISRKLCGIFGKEILGREGIIDRKKLGNIVFSDQEKMDILTDVTWDYMQEKIDEILKNKPEIIILEWALLPISKYWEKSDMKILIQANQDERQKKVIERDEITEEYFEKRDSKSLDYETVNADFKFYNEYEKKQMKDFINQIISKLFWVS